MNTKSNQRAKWYKSGTKEIIPAQPSAFKQREINISEPKTKQHNNHKTTPTPAETESSEILLAATE